MQWGAAFATGRVILSFELSILEMTLVTGQLRLKTQVKYFTDWYTGRAKKPKQQFDGLRTYGCELMARQWSRVLAEEEIEACQGM
jgi:hypothetical protein